LVVGFDLVCFRIQKGVAGKAASQPSWRLWELGAYERLCRKKAAEKIYCFCG
jgi:hypothetical protein